MTDTGLPHSITVRLLRQLLSSLKDDDVLKPNAVANLMIVRDGTYIGFVDLLENHQTIELVTDRPIILSALDIYACAIHAGLDALDEIQRSRS